jgi:hypothetical protein
MDVVLPFCVNWQAQERIWWYNVPGYMDEIPAIWHNQSWTAAGMSEVVR